MLPEPTKIRISKNDRTRSLPMTQVLHNWRETVKAGSYQSTTALLRHVDIKLKI